MSDQPVVPADQTAGEANEEVVVAPRPDTHQFGRVERIPDVAVGAEQVDVPHGWCCHPCLEKLKVLLIGRSHLCSHVLEE